MATLLSSATGNFTASGTWALVDSASYLDSEAGSTASTTSYVYTSTFTPGAITADGIAVKLSARTASPTGTMSIELYNNTGAISITSVTVNVSDLPSSGNGWQFFKFSAPQLLIAATAYKIGFKTSVAGEATLFRDSTAGNWARLLRTTTNQAPASGDQLHIAGELTGAGTGNSFTVTMDNTASTSFGPTVSGGPPQGITVNNRGTFTFGTGASTAYVLKWKGILQVNGGSTLNTGTTGTAMPSTSSATLQMDAAVNVDTGIVIAAGGTWNGRGNALTTTWDRLAADASASATSLTSVSSTGWKNGDTICLSPTTQTASQAESKALTADASGTTLTIAAITNAHSGTNNANGDIRCEIGNLTRNVKITGASSSLQGYISFATTSAVDLQYLEFNNLGSGTTGKRGIEAATTTGSLNFQYNSLHDFLVANSRGLSVTSTSGSNLTISNNVTYNIDDNHIRVAATSAVHVISGNLCIKSNSSSAGMMDIADAGSTVTNNYASGAAGVGNVGAINLGENNGTIGTFSGNVAHSNAGMGIYLNFAPAYGTVLNCRVWRNNSNNGGISLSPNNAGTCNLTIDGLVCFGNASVGMSWTASLNGMLLITNSTFDGGATLVQPIGISLQRCFTDLFIENTTFGSTNAHTIGDIQCTNANVMSRIFMRNVTLASSTEVASQSNMTPGSFISSQKHDQTAGNHKTWMQYGTLSIDTTLYNTASPSLRMTPNNASNKLESAPPLRGFQIPVASGQALTPTAYARKSVVGDGTAYNGNQPRLIVRKNVALGIASDTVLATYASAGGSWNALSGTTASATDDGVMEFVVDCDGTTGWINIDDFTVA